MKLRAKRTAPVISTDASTDVINERPHRRSKRIREARAIWEAEEPKRCNLLRLERHRNLTIMLNNSAATAMEKGHLLNAFRQLSQACDLLEKSEELLNDYKEHGCAPAGDASCHRARKTTATPGARSRRGPSLTPKRASNRRRSNVPLARRVTPTIPHGQANPIGTRHNTLIRYRFQMVDCEASFDRLNAMLSSKNVLTPRQLQPPNEILDAILRGRGSLRAIEPIPGSMADDSVKRGESHHCFIQGVGTPFMCKEVIRIEDNCPEDDEIFARAATTETHAIEGYAWAIYYNAAVAHHLLAARLGERGAPFLERSWKLYGRVQATMVGRMMHLQQELMRDTVNKIRTAPTDITRHRALQHISGQAQSWRRMQILLSLNAACVCYEQQSRHGELRIVTRRMANLVRDVRASQHASKLRGWDAMVSANVYSIESSTAEHPAYSTAWALESPFMSAKDAQLCEQMLFQAQIMLNHKYAPAA